MSVSERLEGKLKKEDIDKYLKIFANKYRKYNKSASDIVIVGGGSIVLNYNFRDSTVDIDAIMTTSSVATDIIYEIANEYNLSTHWMNSDFSILSSYSPKLLEVSKHYRTYNNDKLEIRTVTAEYLIATKMQAGRLYNEDLTDIIGILAYEQEHGNLIDYKKIEAALKYLYGDKIDVSHIVLEKVKKYCNMDSNELWKEYDREKVYLTEVKEEVVKVKREKGIDGKREVKELSEKIYDIKKLKEEIERKETNKYNRYT